ncbi:MAG: ABC transporter substrate-binding protein [Alphaproteobacteria bacterium]|nr:ABC transporter substrate-binding protein [Alphaproteobacteria bacterium]
MKRRHVLQLAAGALAAPSLARAEATELRAAKQFGLGYIQYILMEELGLVEKQAKAAGLGDVKVTWATFRSSDVMNDALVSGSVDFVSLGLPGIATIWSRTRGNMNVRAAAGLNCLPIFLLTRNPAVQKLADFTDKDRIAVPAVKVSNQAIWLQMAAAQLFGEANYQRFDPLTVSMAHPDATAAMLGPMTEVTANFSSPPFQYRQLKDPRVRKLTTAADILGGRSSFNVVATTGKFRDSNPKLYRAYLAALEEATGMVNRDKRGAVEIFLRATNDRTPIDDIMAIMSDPEVEFTTKPLTIAPMIDFMAKTGSLRTKPERWQDLFFAEAVGG